MLLFIILSVFMEIRAESAASNTTSDGYKLEFVQALWRHGDRAALTELYPIYEQNWTFGGGGLGELTTLGMSQMNHLGTIFRKKYVMDQLFLGSRYAANEIYVRSTDTNRTIISAMSLLYGLYPPGAWNIQGVDYPNSGNWQQGFTFIPVHIESLDQCMMYETCSCARWNELKLKWAELPEVQAANAKIMAMNIRIAGYYNITDQPQLFDIYPDSWKCQRNWFNDSLYGELPWYNEQLYAEAQTTVAPYNRLSEGNFVNSSVIAGIDISHEISVIQSGQLLSELYTRAREKVECLESSENCTSPLKTLKWYGYSSHDFTIYALLVALGVPNLVKTQDGWPDTASSLVLELYSIPTSGSRQFFMKFLYRDNANVDFDDVTSQIRGCHGAQMCSMESFQEIVENFRPLPDFQTLCQTPLMASFSFTMHSNFWIILMFISAQWSAFTFCFLF